MERYQVVGNHIVGYAVVEESGAVEYDHLDTRSQAEEICEALNAGVGPEWDAVEKYFTTRGA